MGQGGAMTAVAATLTHGELPMTSKVTFVDLTGDSDKESAPPSKRRKFDSDEIEEIDSLPVLPLPPLPSPGNGHTSTPRFQKPQSQKAIRNSGETIFIHHSPFKSRPSWSALGSTPNSSPAESSAAKTPTLTHPVRQRLRELPQRLSSDPLVDHAVTPGKGSSRVSPSGGPAADKTTQISRSQILTRSLSVRDSRSVASSSRKPRHDSSATRPTSPENTVASSVTPSNSSHIVVEIDNNRRSVADLLSSFQRPNSLPRSSDRLPRKAPPDSTTLINKATRDELRDQLKNDISLAKTQPDFIETVFGTHGFSDFYSTDLDEKHERQFKREVAKRRHRVKKVCRKDVRLDWGSLFEPEDDFDPRELVHPIQQTREILDRRFRSGIWPPVTFVNEIDDKQLHGKFQLISSPIRRRGVERAPPNRNQGCNCIGECHPDTCPCFVSDLEKDENGDCVDHGKVIPYRRAIHPLKSTVVSVLTDDYMNKHSEHHEIIECDEACRCGPQCSTRVVQKGRDIPLEIFMTKECGFGLRCPLDIIEGQFIDLYVGEVITARELENREDATDGAPSYIYSLDWFEAKEIYYVDCINFGAPTRFINHSCNPNCRTFTVMLNRSDRKVYGLAFFAVRDIPAGTELNIDYNPQEQGKRHEPPGPGEDDVVRCRCGSDNCRVRLWPGPKAKKGKGWVRS